MGARRQQVLGRLEQARTARCPVAATPWPLNDGVEHLAVFRVNRRAGATGEPVCTFAKPKHSEQGAPASDGLLRATWGPAWAGGCCQQQLSLEGEAPLPPPAESSILAAAGQGEKGRPGLTLTSSAQGGDENPGRSLGLCL